jgi:hypothetical protein
MNIDTLTKSYGYLKNTRENSQFLFSQKSRFQNSTALKGWKSKQPVDLISLAKVLPSSIEQKIYFELNNTISLAIPKRLESLIIELEHSKYILNLKKGWDGEEAEPYKPEVLKNSIVFLCRYLMSFLENNRQKLYLPKIYHGPNGSIDLLWNSDNFSLLINIDNTGNTAQFSGEIFDKENYQSSEGNFNINCRTFDFLPNLNF